MQAPAAGKAPAGKAPEGKAPEGKAPAGKTPGGKAGTVNCPFGGVFPLCNPAPPTDTAPPPPSPPPVVGVAYSNFSYSVLDHVEAYTQQVQESVATQLAAQLGVAPSQVALKTPYYRVTGVVSVSGYPTGQEVQLKDGLIAYLDVPPAAVNVTVLFSSASRRRLLETATLSVVVQAVDYTQAGQVQERLADSSGMTASVKAYLQQDSAVDGSFVMNGPSLANAAAEAVSMVNVTYSAADMAASKPANLQNVATSTNMKDQVVKAGMPADTRVSILSLPITPGLAPPPAVPAGSPPPPPASVAASGGGSGIAVWVWAVVGVCAGLAIVAAAFIAFVLYKRRAGRAAATTAVEPKRTVSSSRHSQNGFKDGSKDEEFGRSSSNRPTPRGGATMAAVAVPPAAAAAAPMMPSPRPSEVRLAMPSLGPEAARRRSVDSMLTDHEDDTPMPVGISADEANLFQLGSRLPAEQEAAVRAAAAASAQRKLLQSTPEEAEAGQAVSAEITPAGGAAGPGSHAVPAAAPAEITPEVPEAAGPASSGGFGGFMRKLTGGGRGSRSSQDLERAAREAADAAAAAPPPPPPIMVSPRALSERSLPQGASASPRPSPRPDIAPDAVVLVTPPGGGPPIPMVPLAAMETDPAVAYQMGMQAGVAAALRASPAKGPNSGRRSNTPSRAGSISGDRPPRPRRQGSFSNASAYEQPRRAGSVSGRSDTGSEIARRGGFAPGEEEDADEWPLGTVEKCPASLRPPGASVVASFKSDRQKHETVAPDSILTKIVVERTAHLRPGTQFIKSFWMTDGVRATNSSVVRNAVHKVNKQPVSIKFYGRMEDFNRERQLYSLAISPQFVPMMYFCEEGSEDLPPFIITERGDFTLAEVLRKSQPPPQQQKILLHDVACALSQLHSMGLVQMDIRPANIMFFGKEGAWKLVDFENWAWAGQPADVAYALRYAAPEIPAADLLGEATLAAEHSMDLFALGILAYEVMTGKRFYGDASDADVLQMLMGHKMLPSEGDRSVLGQIADKNAQRLLRHLIRRAPSARWDAAKVVSCQWFRTSDFQAYRVTG
ncbi:hypothetical protein ABPG77_003967 [Micractinium sp. CCAP 211/92]